MRKSEKKVNEEEGKFLVPSLLDSKIISRAVFCNSKFTLYSFVVLSFAYTFSGDKKLNTCLYSFTE